MKILKSDNSPLVSIIIPSYNTEQYIGKCLDSLLNQTYINLEIICVDDGSTDQTVEVLKKYQIKDKRIKVFIQKNKYAGIARNHGIKESKGKYLLFVDSDDFCEETMVQELVNKAEMLDTEILVFDLFRYHDKMQKVMNDSWTALHPQLFGEGVKKAEEISDSIFQFTTSGPMNKFFLREFIIKNNIWFQAIPRTNDLYFVYVAFTYANRIAIYCKKLEYYRIGNENSLQATNYNSPLSFLEALRGLRQNLIRRNIYLIYVKSFEKLSVAVSLLNLSTQKDKESFLIVQDAIKDFLMLENNIEGNLILQHNEKVIIYGAGTIAEILVKYLLWIKKVRKENICIVVTHKDNGLHEICGIEVEDTSFLKNGEKNQVLIAVNSEKAQKEISAKLYSRNITNAMYVNFDQILKILFSK